MPDWPGRLLSASKQTLSTLGLTSSSGQYGRCTGTAFNNAAVWPAANRALYCPVWTDETVTVYKMSFIVATQSGNYDIGIYNERGDRLVSKTSTAVPAAGLAIVDIADTVLNPGLYFLALNIDNTTASVNRISPAAAICQSLGVQQQAVGAVTLPDPATFANPASAYIPLVVAHLAVTV